MTKPETLELAKKLQNSSSIARALVEAEELLGLFALCETTTENTQD